MATNDNDDLVLVIEKPRPDTKGYLRRMHQALQFQEAVQGANPPATLIADIVRFMLDYVKEPVDRAEAEAVLWELTQDQFEHILGQITGGDDVPLESNAS